MNTNTKNIKWKKDENKDNEWKNKGWKQKEIEPTTI